METSLFEVQQQLVQLESGREQLETEIQSLRLRCETTTGEKWREGENRRRNQMSENKMVVAV